MERDHPLPAHTHPTLPHRAVETRKRDEAISDVDKMIEALAQAQKENQERLKVLKASKSELSTKTKYKAESNSSGRVASSRKTTKARKTVAPYPKSVITSNDPDVMPLPSSLTLANPFQPVQLENPHVAPLPANPFQPVPLENPPPQLTAVFDLEPNLMPVDVSLSDITGDLNIVPFDVSSSTLANPFQPVPLENPPPEPTAVFELEPNPMPGDVSLPNVAGDLNIVGLGTR